MRKNINVCDTETVCVYDKKRKCVTQRLCARMCVCVCVCVTERKPVLGDTERM